MATAEQRNHAKAYLKKAEEYLASAEDNLAADAGRYTPTAGDAIHATRRRRARTDSIRNRREFRRHTTNCSRCTMTLVEPTSYVMTVSRNGQVSIPAEARSRWNARRVVVVDLGDRVVMRPLPDDPVAELVGKYAGRGPTTDAARRLSRQDEAARASRR